MRILHGTTNPGNQGMKISRAQRKLGHRSDCLVSNQGYAKFGADIDLGLNNTSSLTAYIKRFIAFCKYLPRYDVFHFHSVTFLNPCIDIPILRILRKKVIFHCHGVELIRVLDPELAKTLYGGEFGRITKAIMRINIWLFNRFSNAVLVSEPDLLPYVPNAIWVPQPTDRDYWKSPDEGKLSRGQVRIVHAPSDKRTKGTKYVVSAVDKLRNLGYEVELEVIHGVPYAEVKGHVQRADIFIDQLLGGWYGNATVEAMALRKPVCVYIRDDMKKYLKGCPIINVSPSNLVDKLKPLIRSETLRKNLGARGRKYVEKYHDSMKIAEELIELYSKV